MATLYNTCIRHTVEVCIPQALTRWPVNYKSEMWRAQRHSGHRAFQAIAVSTNDLPHFTETLLRRIESELPWGANAFFLHETKGVKNTTGHNPTDANEMQSAIDHLLEDLNINAIQEDDWHVDIALEYRLPGPPGVDDNVLLWRQDTHWLLVQILTQESDQRAQRRVASSAYTSDLTAQLTDVAGFRLRIPRGVGPWDVKYVNCYTTDKSHTYLVDQGRYAKFTTAAHFLRKKIRGEPFIFAQQLYEVFAAAMEAFAPEQSVVRRACHSDINRWHCSQLTGPSYVARCCSLTVHRGGKSDVLRRASVDGFLGHLKPLVFVPLTLHCSGNGTLRLNNTHIHSPSH